MSSKRSLLTATGLQLGLCAADIFLTGGVGTAATTVVATPKILPSILKRLSGVADNVGAGVVGDWIENQFRNTESHLNQPDFQQLAGVSIAKSIYSYSQERKGTQLEKSLKNLSKKTPQLWKRKAFGRSSKDKDDSSTTPELAFSSGGGIEKREWKNIINTLVLHAHLAREIPDPVREKLVDHVYTEYPKKVKEELQKDSIQGGTAYSGFVLTLLNEILVTTRKHPDREEAGKLANAINKIQKPIVVEINQISKKLDEKAVQRHHQLLTTFDSLLSEVCRELKLIRTDTIEIKQILQESEKKTQKEFQEVKRLLEEKRATQKAKTAPDLISVEKILSKSQLEEDPWKHLLTEINKEALLFYRNVKNSRSNWKKANHKSESRFLVRTLEDYLEELKYWVEVTTSDTGEPAHLKAVSLLEDVLGDRSRKLNLWIVAEPGTGKTTLLYRTYIEIAKQIAEGNEKLPVPMIIQPQSITSDAIEELNQSTRENFLEKIIDVWLENRKIYIPENYRAKFRDSLEKSLKNRSILLLVDSYDELNRMHIQKNLISLLFSTSGLFICATRREAYPGDTNTKIDTVHQTIEIGKFWSLVTICKYLSKRLKSDEDEIQKFIDSLEQNRKSSYLRNPRYLSLLTHFLLQKSDYASANGDVLTSGRLLSAAVTIDEYALLDVFKKNAFDRLQLIADRRIKNETAGIDFKKRLYAAFEKIAEKQIYEGTCPVDKKWLEELTTGKEEWYFVKDCSELIKQPKADGNRYHLELKNFTLIDFFLTKKIANELSLKNGTLNFDHLWSSDLLAFLSAELRLRKRSPESIDNLMNAIWTKLDSQRLKKLEDDAACRSINQKFNVNYTAVNLIHLAAELLVDSKFNTISSRSQISFTSEPDFSNLYLDSVDLSNYTFTKCDFRGSILTNTNLELSTFDTCRFQQVNLRNANAGFSKFIDCEFDFDQYIDKDNAEKIPLSPIYKMHINHVQFEDLLDEFDKKIFVDYGAIESRSRYHSPFGEKFFEMQSTFLGEGLTKAEKVYMKAIINHVKSFDETKSIYLVDLMAGGGKEYRLKKLLKRFANLHVLAIDRDTHQLLNIQEQFSSRMKIKKQEIEGRVGIEKHLKNYFSISRAHIIIGKKGLHELRKNQQEELLAECADVLLPKGRLILLADAPHSISEQGFTKLKELAKPLRATVQKTNGALKTIEKCYLDNLQFSASDDDMAIFSNLWVLLKDWANNNEHEVINRYFSSANQIRSWAATSGLKEIKRHAPFYYTLVARMFNEHGFNRVGLYLKRNSGKINFEDISIIRQYLMGSDKHKLFFRFTDLHLWDGELPTALGSKECLSASKKQISFSKIYSQLKHIGPLPASYRNATAFQFSVYLFEFVKPGSI